MTEQNLIPVEAHILPDEMDVHQQRLANFPELSINLARQPGRGAEELLRVNLAEVLPTAVNPLQIDDNQLLEYVREYLQENDRDAYDAFQRETRGNKVQVFRPQGEQGNILIGPVARFGRSLSDIKRELRSESLGKGDLRRICEELIEMIEHHQYQLRSTLPTDAVSEGSREGVEVGKVK